jgi:hypothetical protein
MEHGDETEGAGMGITMVGILLDQSGIDKHAFSLYSSKKYNETIAKLEIPLTKDYVPKRNAFDKELNKHQVERDQLRDKFTYTYKDYPKYFDDDETVIIETE